MLAQKIKRKLFSRPKLARIIIIASVVICVLITASVFLVPKIPGMVKAGTQVILNKDPYVLKNSDGQTNILVMGIGGGTHDGAELTDTIIIASIGENHPEIVLTAIPRDIYLNTLGQKINFAYSDGKEKGAGLELAKESVSQVSGLPIHYAMVVDFSVFEKVIDILGGVDVDVQRTLDDYEYPITGKENDLCDGDLEYKCRYEHLHFDAGLTHMDGKTALRFVRSRHAQGDEGTDFARSQRQQLVIKAIKEKIFSSKIFLNLSKDLEIYNQVQNNIDTDFDITKANALLTLGLKYQNAQFKNIYLNDLVLYNPPEDYRGWILLPIDNSWEQIHELIATQTAFLKNQPNP